MNKICAPKIFGLVIMCLLATMQEEDYALAL